MSTPYVRCKIRFYFSKIMMNILPRNPADREAKSPCDKNIRYPVCVPRHDSPNGTTFLTIVVYDKHKTALVVDDPSNLINTRRLSPGRKPLDHTRVIRSLGSSSWAFFYCSIRRTLMTLLQLPPRQSVSSRVRGHGTTVWPIRSDDQECNLQYDSNRSVHHQNRLDTRTQFVDTKPVTPTFFDPCRQPVSHCRDLRRPTPAVVNDELTPSK
jgi:hypothetical protein